MTDLAARVTRIEAALVAIGALQFGDSPGHPFHGNQYTGGSGSAETTSGRTVGDAEKIARMAASGSYPNAKAAGEALDNHRADNADKVYKELGGGKGFSSGQHDIGYQDGLDDAKAWYQSPDTKGEASPTPLRQDHEILLNDARQALDSYAEPGSAAESDAAYDEGYAEAGVAFHSAMEERDNPRGGKYGTD